jgi:cytochrome d ubiquinol oxidase subunit II
VIPSRRELISFFCAAALFAAAMRTLSVSFYPQMIPFAITTTQAATPPSTLSFFFRGAGVFILPLTLIYTLVIYIFFKGKVGLEEQAY